MTLPKLIGANRRFRITKLIGANRRFRITKLIGANRRFRNTKLIGANRRFRITRSLDNLSFQDKLTLWRSKTAEHLIEVIRFRRLAPN